MALGYGGGLRVSELVGPDLEDYAEGLSHLSTGPM